MPRSLAREEKTRGTARPAGAGAAKRGPGGPTPTPGYSPRRDPTVRTRPTQEDIARHRSMRHAYYEGGDSQAYDHDPGPGSIWERISRLATAQPVHGNPSMDPAAGDLVQVSYMAGYSDSAGVGHDALQGIDKYVTGQSEEDPVRENLGVKTHHGGHALALAPDESIMSDDLGGDTCGNEFDWCGEL